MAHPDDILETAAIDDLLDRLADPLLAVDEAMAIMRRFDDHEVAAVVPAFRRLHDSSDPAMLHAMARLLSRWADRPVTRALVPALEALLREEAVGDLNKLAAAGLLERLGQPVDYPQLLGKLHDLRAVAKEMLAAVLATSDRPTAVMHALDNLVQMPLETVLAWIDDLGAGGDGRALALLGPLVLAADGDVAISAVAAIDRLFSAHPDRIARRSAGMAGVTLALAAEHHADREVREQARVTYRRVMKPDGGPEGSRGGSLDDRIDNGRVEGGRVGNGRVGSDRFDDGRIDRGRRLDRRPDDPADDAVDVARRRLLDAAATSQAEIYASEPSAAGERLALAVWPNTVPARTFDVLTLHLAHGEGIRHYAGVEHVGVDAMAALLDRLADGGMAVRRLPLDQAVALLFDATQDTVAQGGARSIGYAIWPQVVLAD